LFKGEVAIFFFGWGGKFFLTSKGGFGPPPFFFFQETPVPVQQLFPTSSIRGILLKVGVLGFLQGRFFFFFFFFLGGPPLFPPPLGGTPIFFFGGKLPLGGLFFFCGNTLSFPSASYLTFSPQQKTFGLGGVLSFFGFFPLV